VMGLVHGKTGSLAHVYALAGYATTQRGEHIAFSIMTNNDTMPAKKALDTIDQIVEKMVEDKK